MSRLCLGCMEHYEEKFTICPHCGYAVDTPAKETFHMTPGVVLENRYIIGRVLGFGGFGITYLSYDFLLKKKVAIKEYLPSMLATRIPEQQQISVYSEERREQFQEGLEKIMDEAKRLAAFEAVAGIVQVFDYFLANNTAYIVMEYLEGMTLAEYLKQNGPMPLEMAFPVVIQAASALEIVHKAGVLHRDIAPDNLFIVHPEKIEKPEDIRVKLMDFGAARRVVTKYSKSLTVMIKPGYAPVEQYERRGNQGTWTDVYALAATFYKMITGVTPQDAMERSVADELKKPSKLKVKITKPVETALMNAMNVRIQDRTQTATEFREEMQAQEVKVREATKDKTDVGGMPKWVLAVGGAGAAVAAAVIIMIFTGVIPVFMRTGKNELAKNEVKVPNVISKDADEAEVLLKELELGITKDKMVYSKEIPQNLISYQEIKDGSTVSKHTPVTVWISMGEEKGVFPNVEGMQREEALAALEKAGFTNVRVEETEAEGAFDSVIKVSEKAGDNVVLDQEIVITVNIREAVIDETVLVTVPDLAGKHKDAAQQELTAAGLKVTFIYESSDEYETDMVIRQTPAAGEELNKDSYVEVVVSTGAEKIYMVNVTLEDEVTAREAIENLGLVVEDAEAEYSDTVPAGRVIRQSVELGQEVKKGDGVKLVISLGAEPVAETAPAPTRAAPKETQPRQTQPQNTAPAATAPPPTKAPTAPPPTETQPPATTAPPPTETQPPATTAPPPPPTTAAPPPAPTTGGGWSDWDVPFE